ncbi:hypothetical protein K461DRAFT_57969 [Myriangium duriaei CBS 260.36]|uniref:Uncharacterized protein n=1 Tax=Myriangium duriaei CBS 260.36 TaxID=1168546 RepID=A0A9P4MHS5_9PEZI|nr:hypothetical protein K461DRAFT_57969 [Myriangium duriaei CBS 260.36]
MVVLPCSVSAFHRRAKGCQRAVRARANRGQQAKQLPVPESITSRRLIRLIFYLCAHYCAQSILLHPPDRERRQSRALGAAAQTPPNLVRISALTRRSCTSEAHAVATLLCCALFSQPELHWPQNPLLHPIPSHPIRSRAHHSHITFVHPSRVGFSSLLLSFSISPPSWICSPVHVSPFRPCYLHLLALLS